MKKISTKGITKQDLAAQRAALKEAQKAANQALKEFRHNVAQLKKKGLLDKHYDARSVKPTKYLKTQIKRFTDVLRGEAQPVKVSREKQKYYKEQGYKTKAGRVVVPVAKNQKVYGTHGNFVVKTTTPTGSITRIDTGLRVNRISEWENELRKIHVRLKEGERLGFQYYGNNSYQTFSSIEQMIERFHYYPSYEQAEMSHDPDKQEQTITNIVIFKMERGARMPETSEAVEMRQARLAKQAAVRREYIERMTPERRELYNERRAEAEKKRRQKKAAIETPEQAEERKRKARERARKSYSERSVNGKKKNSGD